MPGRCSTRGGVSVEQDGRGFWRGARLARIGDAATCRGVRRGIKRLRVGRKNFCGLDVVPRGHDTGRHLGQFARVGWVAAWWGVSAAPPPALTPDPQREGGGGGIARCQVAAPQRRAAPAPLRGGRAGLAWPAFTVSSVPEWRGRCGRVRTTRRRLARLWRQRSGPARGRPGRRYRPRRRAAFSTAAMKRGELSRPSFFTSAATAGCFLATSRMRVRARLSRAS